MPERIEIPDTFPQPGDVDGRRVVITGAGRGLGEVIAHAFSRAGAKVALVARTERDLKEVADALPGPTLVFSGDVRDADFNEAVADGTVAEWGGVDVWICNAGISPIVAGPLGDRAGGVARGDRRQPHRRVPRRPGRRPRDGRGRTVDLHRLGARRAAAQGTHRRTARRRPGSSAWPRAWRSTSRRPASPSTSCRPAGSSRRSPRASPTTSGSPSRSCQHTALRRWGTSADLAGAFQFLASDAAAFVTGTVIHVDGGYQLV